MKALQLESLYQKKVQSLHHNTQGNMTTRTSPKTPYEIRLELLELARTILQSEHDAKAVLTAGRTAPTTEQIIEHAEKMNVFVSKANSPNHNN